ncbi:MAG: MupG family TIM beta-alpha barrel fold protein, partial [Sporomusaceae bacterium]|nr:MupG family TIM beta-alpha barrel fold protein [Sporomusaceae bacterium]
MTKGISLYPGLGHSREKSFAYLDLARKNGFSTLFTSLHIPEADAAKLVFEFQELTQEALRLGFKITADISPAALKFLGGSFSDLTPLKKLGLSALRLDFGFTPTEIAHLSQKTELELNASTLTEPFLRQIKDAGTDLSRITVCHNYYPRPETGLSFAFLADRAQLFRAHGLKTAAFIPSLANKRAPIYAGLPTLEEHRYLNPLLAAKHLFYSGCATEVRFGDPLAAAAEITAVGALSETCAELNLDLLETLTPLEAKILFSPHTNRLDPGEWTIRSAEARTLAT